MDKIRRKRKFSIRMLVQLLFAAVTNGYIFGFFKGKIYQGNLKKLCVPGLNCYSCPGALGACPLGAFQNAMAAADFKIPFYLLGFFIAAGAFFGRFICGWLCPFGLFQELLYKIPFIKKLKNLPGHSVLKYLKYFLLTVFVILLPFAVRNFIGYGQPWFCKYICPSGTLSGWLLMLGDSGLAAAAGFLFSWKSFLLVAIILLSILSYRPFCKYICPLGALYGLFHPIAFYKISVNHQKCTGCGACHRECPMDIPVNKTPKSPECIRCGRCTKICPHGALSMGLGTIKQHTKRTYPR